MEKTQIEREQKIIDLERKYAVHSEHNHRIRSWFYKMLIRHYEKTK